MPDPIISQEQVVGLLAARKPAQNLVADIAGGANALLPHIANLHAHTEVYQIAPTEENAARVAEHAKGLRDAVLAFLGALEPASEAAMGILAVLDPLAALVPEPEEPEDEPA